VTVPRELERDYPAYRAVDIALRDGSTVGIRPVSALDLDLVVDLFARLSQRSIRMRFHGVATPSRKALRRFVEVDYRTSFSLIAESGLADNRSAIALATYMHTAPRRAEMALVVDDSFQGLGLGSVLIEHLGEAAAEAGISIFEADVLASNSDMLEVVRNLKLPVETSLSAGVVHAEFPTSPTPQAIESFEMREAMAASAGVARLVRPRSIAVIGASRRRGSIGGEVFHNLIETGFEGPVFPINPKSDVIQSIHAYPSVLDAPGEIDLAVIVLPAPLVNEAALQ
jgi:acetate---CoA ligase (ADP-forming)